MEDRLKNKLSNIENGSSHPSAPSEHLDDEAPTAPSLDQEPSAPAMIQTFHSPECVVCLERKVSKHRLGFSLFCPPKSFAKRIITLALNYTTLLSQSPSLTASRCIQYCTLSLSSTFNLIFEPQRVLSSNIEIEMPSSHRTRLAGFGNYCLKERSSKFSIGKVMSRS